MTPNQLGSTGPGFALGWNLFRIAVWVTIAVWVHPRLLDLVGGEDISRWLLDHPWVRWLGALPLGLLALISAFELIDDPGKRAAREELACSTGGTLVKLNDIDPTYGIPTGPGLRVPLGRWSMVVGTWKQKSKTHTVASVDVETRSTFSFVARGTGSEPSMLRGLQQWTVAHAARQRADRADDPRAAAAAATLAYLAEPPIMTGNASIDRAVVLRANQPDTARALLTSSAVASAIAALDAKIQRWDWTFYPATAGIAEMRLECPGVLADRESLGLVQTLMRAALEELAGADAIAA